MLMLALALLSAIPEPTPEALALGRRLAETGTLAAVLPIKIQQETEELLAEHPEWNDVDQAALRDTAAAQARAGMELLIGATGRAYAGALSIEDLRILVRFNESPAAMRWRQATPGAIAAAMAEAGQIDFKGDTRRAFCTATGKGCPAR